MVQIFPFQSLRYHPDRVSDLGLVTAPPYDVIEKDEQQALYDKHPANVVRLILNQKTPQDSETESVYTRAGAFFKAWQKEGILIPDEAPMMLAYAQEFPGPDGKPVTRRGLIALLKLEPYETGQILPHEFTIGKYKTDRLNLMKATGANLSQIFMIYGDPERHVEKKIFDAANLSDPQWRHVIDKDQVKHSVSPITDVNTLQSIQQLMADQKLLIADGHHRFETALNFKQEVRARIQADSGETPPEGSLLSDYVMVFLSNLDDPGLLVFPTHRVLMHWPTGWDQQKFETELLNRFEKTDTAADFMYVGPGGSPRWSLKLKDQSLISALPDIMKPLDVAILDEVVFKGMFNQPAETLKEANTLRFYRDEALVKQMIENNEVVATFYMAAPSVPLVKQICEAGYRMPQKSTYFYPKILSGLVFYSYQNFSSAAKPGNDSHALSQVIPTATPVNIQQLFQPSLCQ